MPLPKVRGLAEEEVFSVVNTGKKTSKKSWKRMITKPTFVGPNFTRRDPKRKWTSDSSLVINNGKYANVAADLRRTIYPPDWLEIQEGTCHTQGARRDGQPAYSVGQEKSVFSSL